MDFKFAFKCACSWVSHPWSLRNQVNKLKINIFELISLTPECIEVYRVFPKNVFTEFSDKIYLWLKGLFEPATARHMWETGSFNWPQFILQWFFRFNEFVEFNEFPFHLGKTRHSPRERKSSTVQILDRQRLRWIFEIFEICKIEQFEILK